MLKISTAALYRALTFVERLDAFRKYLGHAVDRPIEPTAAAHVTLELWRQEPSLADDGSFNSLLEFYKLTPEEFIQLLSVSAHDLSPFLDALPDWLTFTHRSFKRNLSKPYRHPPGAEQWATELLRPVERIAAEGEHQLDRELMVLEESLRSPFFERKCILDQYRRMTHEALLEVVIKPVVVELHIASRSGALRSGDPSARYEEFIGQLANSATTQEILERYPVLVRLSTMAVQRTVAAIVEMINRICVDRRLIARCFNNEFDVGPLKRFHAGLGDPHRSGRTVARLEFASGVTVIYKPRPLAIDRFYQEVLSFVADKLEKLSFRFPKVADQGCYGYMEFLEARSCNSREQVRRSFYRYGVQMAVLYLLGGTDFHLENVLACDENPVFVDLETMLVPILGLQPLHSASAETYASVALQDSVMRTRLLPHLLKLDPELGPVDLSGMGGPHGQTASIRVPQWHDVGTDRMAMKRETAVLPNSANLPKLAQKAVVPLEFSSDIVEGFSDAFSVLSHYRKEIEKLLYKSADIPVRAVLRSTYEYAFILGESYHPYLLGDALDRDRFFDQLWAGVKDRPELQDVFLSEKLDLWHGDIPIFTTRPDSTSLWTSSGVEIPEFFKITGIEAAFERLKELTEVNLGRQVGFIHASLAASAMWRGASVPRKRLRLRFEKAPLAAALAIGDFLVQQSFRTKGDATWITFLESSPGFHEPLVAGNDLYSGVPGIVLFLAYLGRVSEREEFSTLARSGLTSLVASKAQTSSVASSCGAFDGIGGIIFALTHLAALLADNLLFDLADEYVDRAEIVIATATKHDVVSGIAGCLLALLANHSAVGSKRALQVARQCGDILLDHIIDGEGELHGLGVENLSADFGFAHGLLGKLYSLRRLYLATMEPRYSKPVNRLVRWLDNIQVEDLVTKLRYSQGEANTWCRGLSGSVGSLIRTIPLPGHETLSRVIDEYATRMSEEPLLESDCLCHGELGNLDVMLDAGFWFTSRQWRRTTDRRTRQLLDRAAREGWACGSPVAGPGLMEGLSGIGYQMLRAYLPQEIPSILFLEPPRESTECFVRQVS